mmetsp:Transcript_15650/g.42245  ORF Transcript_15650/g.42245 Transcript_15650/m.42245 type:complete len:332 (+) Transcript_15650:2471-3466(+)
MLAVASGSSAVAPTPAKAVNSKLSHNPGTFPAGRSSNRVPGSGPKGQRGFRWNQLHTDGLNANRLQLGSPAVVTGEAFAADDATSGVASRADERHAVLARGIFCSQDPTDGRWANRRVALSEGPDGGATGTSSASDSDPEVSSVCGSTFSRGAEEASSSGVDGNTSTVAERESRWLRLFPFGVWRESSEKTTSAAKCTLFLLVGSARLLTVFSVFSVFSFSGRETESFDQKLKARSRMPGESGEDGEKSSGSGGSNLPCFTRLPDRNSSGFSGWTRTTSRITFSSFSSIRCLAKYCWAACNRICTFCLLSSTASTDDRAVEIRNARIGSPG